MELDLRFVCSINILIFLGKKKLKQPLQNCDIYLTLHPSSNMINQRINNPIPDRFGDNVLGILFTIQLQFDACIAKADSWVT